MIDPSNKEELLNASAEELLDALADEYSLALDGLTPEVEGIRAEILRRMGDQPSKLSSG